MLLVAVVVLGLLAWAVTSSVVLSVVGLLLVLAGQCVWAGVALAAWVVDWAPIHALQQALAWRLHWATDTLQVLQTIAVWGFPALTGLAAPWVLLALLAGREDGAQLSLAPKALGVLPLAHAAWVGAALATRWPLAFKPLLMWLALLGLLSVATIGAPLGLWLLLGRWGAGRGRRGLPAAALRLALPACLCAGLLAVSWWVCFGEELWA